jgi:TatD DNase family protein
MIIDTHAHIDQLEDLTGALGRAQLAGVTDIVAMSVDLPSMRKVLEISRQYTKPKIHPALGIHPGLVSAKGGDAPGARPPAGPEDFEFLRAHIGQASAVGETGLDYWYKWVRKDQHERQLQKDSFAVHLELARTSGLPIVIHSRGAWEDCLAMTQAAGVKRALFHWYSGPVDILERVIAAGFYVSTSPSVAYSPESRRAMEQAPLERILVETDAPVHYKENDGTFLAEPKDVVRTWKALAELKNLDQDHTLAVVNANAKRFFGL